MSDFNSSLPVRTQNDGDLVVKIGDGTLPSQYLSIDSSGRITVLLQDGSGNALSSTGGALNISDGGGSLTVDATDLDIRDLSHSQDSVKIGDGTEFLAVNADGSLNITDNGGSLTVDATDLDIRDLAFATDKVDVSGSSVTVSATDLDIRDLSASQDSVKAWIQDSAGNAFSSSNPLPVSISADVAGDEINSYSTSAALAGGGSSNHDYTVSAGKTLLLKQIEASGSGKMKIEIQIETAVASGVFSSKFVQFNSTADTNMSLHLEAAISVAAGVRVRVIRTNRDNQAQDVYSTISGFEV